MTECYDLIIVGAGFAGSLMAMVARRLGHSVVLLERGTHPRVVIGESSTPLSNLLLEEIATTYDLPRIAPLAKYGTWQKAYPVISCGLKRGFTFHHHVLGQSPQPDALRQDQLLVAASPNDNIADTHWYRADVDHFLVREAQALGVDYLDNVELASVNDRTDSIAVCGRRKGVPVAYSGRLLIDATGPRGFLHKHLGLTDARLPGYPPTQGLYSHFSGVGRLRDGSFSRTPDVPPYPIDNAAVHHVFDGGWIWVLQFNNGITSAGVALSGSGQNLPNLSKGADTWRSIISQIPALEQQFRSSTAVRPFTHIPSLSFVSSQVSGHRWVMLPSAAGFVDPLLSTGFPLGLLGVSRLGEAIAHSWESPDFAQVLEDNASITHRELMATSRLIAALYASMDNFALFTAILLLYFVAATYAETTRRLRKDDLRYSFLLDDHPVFGPACRRLLDRVSDVATRDEANRLISDILEAIEPFNLAKFGDTTRKNWYPVLPEDLFDSAAKVDSDKAELLQMLRNCGVISSSV